jgi:outer membrane receptor protein involved in Fe transport
LLSRLYYYDRFRDYPTDGAFGFNTGERWMMDVELSYTFLNLPFTEALTIAAGAENVFDEYPRRNPQARGAGLKNTRKPRPTASTAASTMCAPVLNSNGAVGSVSL